MRYTQTDICTRLTLAKCCLSDIAIRMFDSAAIGDLENENCLLEKGIMLKAAMDALCRWYPAQEYTLAYYYGPIASGGRVTIDTWTFGTENVLDHGDSFTSDFTQSISDAVNAKQRYGNVAITSTVESTARLNVVFTYPASMRGTEPTATTSVGSLIGVESEPETAVSADPLPCLDDDGLEGIFNVIDKICGCNCPDQHSTDTIPTYLQ